MINAYSHNCHQSHIYLAESCEHTGIRHHLKRERGEKCLQLAVGHTAQLDLFSDHSFFSYLGTYGIFEVRQNKGVRRGANHRLLHQGLWNIYKRHVELQYI